MEVAKSKIANPNYSQRSLRTFTSFDDFYPFYLGEHCNKINRRLHLFGTTNSVLLAVYAILKRNPKYALYGLLQGYFFAWVGHFFFEKNKPATFKHPRWSLQGDFKMWWEVMTGQRKF